MQIQPPLPGLAPPPSVAPSRQDRVFFAVMLPADVARRARRLAWQLRDRLHLQAWPRNSRLFHISLFGFGEVGEVPPGLATAAVKAASTITLPPFEVTFDRVMSFGHPTRRPLVLLGGEGAAGVTRLERSLGEAMAKAGFRWTPGGYTPHVTLMYGEKDIGTCNCEPISWRVDGIELIHSLYGRSRYLTLASCPLRG